MVVSFLFIFLSTPPEPACACRGVVQGVKSRVILFSVSFSAAEPNKTLAPIKHALSNMEHQYTLPRFNNASWVFSASVFGGGRSPLPSPASPLA